MLKAGLQCVRPTRKAYTERQGNRILATNPKEDARMANPLIAFDPDGRPIIAGTQVTVKEVLKKLAAWGSVDRVLSAHPELGPPAAIRDCSRATGFIQLVHDAVRQGFVDGLQLGLHATYPAQDVS